MNTHSFPLNELAWRRCDALAKRAGALNIAVSTAAAGTRIIDCGTQAAGGLEAGRVMAEICLADLGNVDIVAIGPTGSGSAVSIRTDRPVAACMASQYAGWQISCGKFFAMGSGPMRAAACREPLLSELGIRDRAARVVGVLETSKLPTDEACAMIAEQCGVTPDCVTLLVARTASIAGTVQVVARSVETALHKMHAIGMDLAPIVSAMGIAALPPVAADDLVGIGRTNDAVLYGSEVTLWLRGDDEQLAQLGPKIPSSDSADYGEPFQTIFERYNRDFYKIDPLLFSPAVVTLVNLATGVSHRFGQLRPDILERSFAQSLNQRPHI
jgi:methenyltetrahydromethanopterin cyclohydrolase